MTPADPSSSNESGYSYNRLHGRQILVVEDDPFIACEIEDAIGLLSAHAVGPALSVSSALQLLENSKIDAAILDVNVNGEMVFPVADILTKKKIPIVFQTGNANTDAILALYPSAKLLKKPTCMTTLLNHVADSL